jgi:hypothetical protein
MRYRGTEKIAAENSKVKFMGEVIYTVFQGGVRKRPAVLEHIRFCAVVLLISIA